MKKILLFTFLLGLCGCNSLGSSKGKGELVRAYKNVYYIIKYDTHTYDIVLEFDNVTSKITKKDTIDFEDVYTLPQTYENKELENEYLVYENGKSLYVYYPHYKD